MRRATESATDDLPDTEFLSTPSVRRATQGAGSAALTAIDFYPRPPCGGRPQQRAYREANREFLSTPSVRRATLVGMLIRATDLISIHALRAEGDSPSSGS